MRADLAIMPVAMILMLAVTRGDEPRQGTGVGEELTGPPTWYGLFVTLPRDTFAAGEPIPLRCEFRNRSESPVTIWRSGFFTNHFVSVRDEAGREPPLTVEGRMCRASFAPRGPRPKNYPATIPPGGAVLLAGKRSAKVDLAEMYRLTPGRYAVAVVYEEHQEPAMKLSSDWVEFEVKPRQ